MQIEEEAQRKTSSPRHLLTYLLNSLLIFLVGDITICFLLFRVVATFVYLVFVLVIIIVY